MDALVTHDAPSGVRVPGATGHGWAADAVHDADAHRERLRQVVDAVRPRQLWHGYYHVQYQVDLDLGRTQDRPESTAVCKIHGLDRDDT